MHPLLFEDPTKHMKLGYTNSLDLWIFHCVKDNTPNKLTCKWCDKMIHCIHYHPLILLWLMHFICHTLCFILSPPDWRIPQKKTARLRAVQATHWEAKGQGHDPCHGFTYVCLWKRKQYHLVVEKCGLCFGHCYCPMNKSQNHRISWVDRDPNGLSPNTSWTPAA